MLNEKEEKIEELSKENDFLNWYCEELAAHLPKDLVQEFRDKTKKNGDIQRQLVIEMMERYISGN